MTEPLFSPIPSSPELERVIQTPDSSLRKELKVICDHCGDLVYLGPNVEEGHAYYKKHLTEEHER